MFVYFINQCLLRCDSTTLIWVVMKSSYNINNTGESTLLINQDDLWCFQILTFNYTLKYIAFWHGKLNNLTKYFLPKRSVPNPTICFWKTMAYHFTLDTIILGQWLK